LNGFKLGHNFTGKIESHNNNCLSEVIIYLNQCKTFVQKSLPSNIHPF